MSIAVDLATLGQALGRHHTAYLLTGGDGRPHVAEVFPELRDGVLLITEPGRTARQVVGEQPAVTVLLPPQERAGYTLIVDGEAVLDADGALHITPSHAVLHRAAAHGHQQDPSSECGNDCRPVPERPEIVCICGSSRFVDEMNAAHRELTFAGLIVVAPGVVSRAEDHEADELLTHEQRTALGALHLRKIDLADRVLVVNPGGYVGESTSREIAYAHATGKPISFTDPTRVPRGLRHTDWA